VLAFDISFSDRESVGCARFQILLFLVKCEVESLVGLAAGDGVGWEDGQAAARGVLRCVASILVLF